MSTRRLAVITTVPPVIKKTFREAEPPATSEIVLWRERAARMTLDALGHTNLTVKPDQHNEVVLYARRWFRQLYAHHPDPRMTDDAIATFDVAGVLFGPVKDAVLAASPILFEIDNFD